MRGHAAMNGLKQEGPVTKKKAREPLLAALQRTYRSVRRAVARIEGLETEREVAGSNGVVSK